jgi:hypothetical protein
MKLKCGNEKCHHVWNYTGQSKVYATCPMCKRPAKIAECRQSHPEIFILLALGITPVSLIKSGYSSNTVYKYNRQLPLVKKNIEKAFSIGMGKK